MKKHSGAIMAAALVLTIILSNIGAFIGDGICLERLRGRVLRLHIIANSDSDEDQRLKLCVRDALLNNEEELFGEAGCLAEAELAAEENLPEIKAIAERTLREQGCNDEVKAEITDMYFDERVYGDITMPAGNYRALRITIGEAKGHNWWCVMYPPLCLPAACGIVEDSDTEQECFDKKEREILHKPKKYRVRFALWDKIKSWF